MKNKFLALLAIITLAFTACKKDDNTPSIKAGDYQPITVGSTWSYRNTAVNPFDPSEVIVDTTVNTMTAEMKQIGALYYHKLLSVTDDETLESYIGYANDVYTYRFEDEAEDIAFDLPYLNDKLAAGENFITALNKIGEVESRYVTTIVEKGITKNVLNKTYQNVIHSKVDLQFKQAGQWKSGFVFEFYTAKNVGLISLVGTANNTEMVRTELFNHSIK